MPRVLPAVLSNKVEQAAVTAHRHHAESSEACFVDRDQGQDPLVLKTTPYRDLVLELSLCFFVRRLD